MEKGDLSLAIRLAHTLKGVGRTVGAYDVSQIAEKIQELLQENIDNSDIYTQLYLLENSINVVLNSVKNLYPKPLGF